MDACTIIAKNYLAYARVLARSFTRHHPADRFHVLVIDEVDGHIRAEDEPFELVTPGQIGLPDFEEMAARYDVLELSTAVKPWLLRWMLRESPAGALYLDPDMRLYRPLDELMGMVEEHGLVLSPHNVDPMPRDGKRPNEQDILSAGTYNLGFIGLGGGPFADELLGWWEERLERDCVIDPERGYFVDQRWIDLVPSLAPSFHLLRDRGFNVAYWNLATRPITADGEGGWLAAGEPLRLMHFSGFDPETPHVLSKHQDRILLTEHPELAGLCAGYAEELLANGAEEVRDWPYTYGATASGMVLTRPLRRALRMIAEDAGLPGTPFGPAGELAYLAAANEPAAPEHGGAAGVTRVMAAMHADQEHLWRAFPDLAGVDGPRYVTWARRDSGDQLPDQLHPPEPPPPTAPALPPGADGSRLMGVNVAGYLNSELGVGEVARQAISALDAGGVPVVPMGISAPASRQGHAFHHRGATEGPYPVNLVCVNADVLPAFAREMGDAFFDGRRTVGWWWWEVEQFPAHWLGSFRHVDELWSGSRFVRDTLAAVATVPVTWMPLPVSVAGAPQGQRRRLGLPEDVFTFLFAFDYASVLERKNPLGTLRAFLQAFPEPGEALLVLKSINGDGHPDERRRVRDLAEGHAHVILLEHYLAPSDKDALVASSDCYVSLHRSEGFGITLAEAMLLGKPVIATGYSGNLDFMTEANSWLVRHELVGIGPGSAPYPADARWAEPDLGHAAALMREVFDQPERSTERAARGAAEIARTHAPEVVGARMRGRLEELVGELPAPRRDGWEAPASRRIAEHARARVRAGSRPGTAEVQQGRARQFARKATLRILRPYSVHQQMVDEDVVDALDAAVADTRQLSARTTMLESIALRGLRDVEQRLRGLLEPEIGAAQDRIDDLAGQLDELRQSAREDVVIPDRYPDAPAEPWSHEYNAAHAGFVARALADPHLLQRIHDGEHLPAGYGLGFDERVVEFPWLAGHDLSGTVLDAGSTLNHRHVLRALRERMDDLHIVTLAPEERSFPELDVSYLYADLRDLPMRDDTYDRVVSLSTLEHVGLDLEHFGANGGEAADPQAELLKAVDELRRVVKPGGEVLISVPVGESERFDWVRCLSPDEVDELVERFGAADVDLRWFRHDGGWKAVDRDSVAGARYRDHLAGVAPRGRVVAAEAVACVMLRV